MAPRTRAQRKRAREEEDERRCRLCLEGEADGPLVQLCACRGSAKLVHRRCLEKWRRTSPKEDAAYRCGECKDEYRDALSLELLSARLQAERARGVDGFSSTSSTLAAELRGQQGKYDEAEPLFREVLDLSDLKARRRVASLMAHESSQVPVEHSEAWARHGVWSESGWDLLERDGWDLLERQLETRAVEENERRAAGATQSAAYMPAAGFDQPGDNFDQGAVVGKLALLSHLLNWSPAGDLQQPSGNDGNARRFPAEEFKFKHEEPVNGQRSRSLYDEFPFDLSHDSGKWDGSTSCDVAWHLLQVKVVETDTATPQQLVQAEMRHQRWGALTMPEALREERLAQICSRRPQLGSPPPLAFFSGFVRFSTRDDAVAGVARELAAEAIRVSAERDALSEEAVFQRWVVWPAQGQWPPNSPAWPLAPKSKPMPTAARPPAKQSRPWRPSHVAPKEQECAVCWEQYVPQRISAAKMQGLGRFKWCCPVDRCAWSSCPHAFNCTHTFCPPCTAKLPYDGHFRCPLCRAYTLHYASLQRGWGSSEIEVRSLQVRLRNSPGPALGY